MPIHSLSRTACHTFCPSPHYCLPSTTTLINCVTALSIIFSPAQLLLSFPLALSVEGIGGSRFTVQDCLLLARKAAAKMDGYYTETALKEEVSLFMLTDR